MLKGLKGLKLFFKVVLLLYILGAEGLERAGQDTSGRDQNTL
jgi:hypothetical protein